MNIKFYKMAHWCNGLGYAAFNFGNGGWVISIYLVFWMLDINTLTDKWAERED